MIQIKERIMSTEKDNEKNSLKVIPYTIKDTETGEVKESVAYEVNSAADLELLLSTYPKGEDNA
jgi:hypothetical protein